MWVARDIDGCLYMYYTKPQRNKKGWWINLDNGKTINDVNVPFKNKERRLPSIMFKELKWEDEPIEVELNQIFKSKEHNMLSLLEKVYSIADEGTNPFLNDAGGTVFCNDIKNTVIPIIKKIKNDINLYKIES